MADRSALTVANIDSIDFDRPLVKLLDTIDFEAIADHWLARFSGYRRCERRADL